MSARFIASIGQPANTSSCRAAPNGGRHIAVAEACSPGQLAQAAGLMRDFIEWCRTRYADRAWMVDRYFQPAAVAQEFASLGQTYAAPGGAVLLAQVNDLPAGCVALRTIGDGNCEMKRLFIRAPFQGLGLGRGLCDALIVLARQRGFQIMRLETGDKQPEAHALYRSLGFAEIAPYYDAPAELLPYLTFMERRL